VFTLAIFDVLLFNFVMISIPIVNLSRVSLTLRYVTFTAELIEIRSILLFQFTIVYLMQ